MTASNYDVKTSKPIDYMHDDVSVTLGNRLFITEKFITGNNASQDYPNLVVENNKVIFNYPNNYKYSVSFTSHDLSGKSGATALATTGLSTIFDSYGQQLKGANFIFPQGSACIIIDDYTNQPVYDLDSSYSTKSTLAEWAAGHSNVVYDKVGTNNEFDAAHYIDESGRYKAAVMYNGQLYLAEYSDGKNPVGMSLPVSSNECAYNSIAANALTDFLKSLP